MSLWMDTPMHVLMEAREKKSGILPYYYLPYSLKTSCLAQPGPTIVPSKPQRSLCLHPLAVLDHTQLLCGYLKDLNSGLHACAANTLTIIYSINNSIP